MSYILYSSIARAGGIDLFLGTESFAYPTQHPLRRRPRTPGRLRRGGGRALIAFGGALTRWGRAWATTHAGTPSAQVLRLAAE